MPRFTISLAQMPVVSGNERRNIETMKTMVQEAARRGSQIVVLPELWSAGYHYEDIQAVAHPLNGGVFVELANAASQNKICVTGSMPEKRGDSVNNTAPFFTHNGRIMGVYRKIHLFSPMHEGENFKGGQAPYNLDAPWGKTALAICYDLRFPEMFRRYGIEGTKLVLLPGAWPLARIEHWRTLIRARAIENQYFVAACNTVGETLSGEGPTVFGGHSMIVDPWGDTVLEAGTAPGVYTAEIEMDLVDDVRGRIPVFQDRKPEYYGLDDIMSRLDF